MERELSTSVRSVRKAVVLNGVATIIVMLICGADRPALQDFDQASCDEFRVAPRSVNGQRVGPVSCMMQETDVALKGRNFRRLDIGLDGTVEGHLTSRPDTRAYFTNAPELVFAQLAAPRPYLPGIATYARNDGASMTVLYPLDVSSWNGKMWVTAHGDGTQPSDRLLPWHRNLDRKNPMKDLNAYDRMILSKGYVLVKTRRATIPGASKISAKLADGTIVEDVSFTDSARYISDFTAVAKRAVATRLGRPPARTYLYGHASGGSIGHALNYTPGLNAGPDGRPVFDGVLADDAASGVWLPLALDAGPQPASTKDSGRAHFVPQIDVTHQMNNAVWRAAKADGISPSALANARRNAILLRKMGLASKTRTYEVRAVSSDAGQAPVQDPATSYVDLAPLMDSLIDHLDRWVTQEAAPPETRSDSIAVVAEFGRDGVRHGAIEFPEVACPLGVYHPYPGPTGSRTAFAPFAPEDLEPLDADGGFVDMNGNGVRDRREAPAQAWQRLGLLGRGEQLTREKYIACVRVSADRLREDGFLTGDAAKGYIDRASTASLSPQTTQR